MQQENNVNTEFSLLDELDKVTEFKAPSDIKIPSWNFTEIEEDTVKTNIGQETEQQSEDAPTGKLNPKDNRIYAEASAAGVDLVTSILSESIVNIRYYKKFTSEEREALDGFILDAPDSKLNDEQRSLKSKFERRMRERDSKLKKLTPSEAQRERMINAFEKYQQLTGKTVLTPGWMLGIAIGESLIKSGVEAFLD